MLLMRRREEAEGESRMMGSGRRVGFLERTVVEDGFGGMEAAVVVVEEGCVERRRLRPRNVSAVLRTWEKSWVGVSMGMEEVWGWSWGWSGGSYCGLDAS